MVQWEGGGREEGWMEECLCFPLLFSFPACQTLGQSPFLFPFVAVVVVAAPSVVHFFVASLLRLFLSSPVQEFAD